jgi:hypothetical protein
LSPGDSSAFSTQTLVAHQVLALRNQLRGDIPLGTAHHFGKGPHDVSSHRIAETLVLANERKQVIGKDLRLLLARIIAAEANHAFKKRRNC